MIHITRPPPAPPVPHANSNSVRINYHHHQSSSGFSSTPYEPRSHGNTPNKDRVPMASPSQIMFQNNSMPLRSNNLEQRSQQPRPAVSFNQQNNYAKPTVQINLPPAKPQQ